MRRVKHILIKFIGPWIEFEGPGDKVLTACNRIVMINKPFLHSADRVTCKACLKKEQASAPKARGE